MVGPFLIPDLLREFDFVLEIVGRVIAGISPEAWSAMAAWVTVGVAGVAAVIALRQVREAQRTREAQAQPNIAVFTEAAERDWQKVELRVKNYGQTGAYRIRLTFDAPLAVTPWYYAKYDLDITSVDLPAEIAFLAPGQVWRTFWDDAVERLDYNKSRREEGKAELQAIYQGQVEFEDHAGRTYTNPILIDSDMYRNTLRVKEQSD
ncbi:hypothetical protein [Mycobacteroides abscessus]